MVPRINNNVEIYYVYISINTTIFLELKSQSSHHKNKQCFVPIYIRSHYQTHRHRDFGWTIFS